MQRIIKKPRAARSWYQYRCYSAAVRVVGTLLRPVSFLPMSSERIIVEAIKVAQDLLCQNLPAVQKVSDAALVMRFRELVRSQAIRSALDRSSDTLLTFALRAVERAVSDQSRTNRETINQLWDILDDPHLNKALGLPQNSRMTFRRSRF